MKITIKKIRIKLLFLLESLFEKFSDLIGYRMKKIEGKSFFHFLKINKRFKDIHSGKRCFILGNGPSTKEIDFSLLSNEYVMTVNQAARNENFSKLKTDYHFWADPCFFNLDLEKAENRELLNQMLKVNTKDNKPECFFPVYQKEYIEKTGLNKELKINFFCNGSELSKNFNRKNDFTHLIPSFHTVVQYAIFLADYMGFSEIYLLGCETTSIFTSIKSRLDLQFENDYGYELSENEQKRMRDLNDKRKYSQELYSNYRSVTDYALLKQYCEHHGHKLVNCTPVSLIESVPRMRFEDVLAQPKS